MRKGRKEGKEGDTGARQVSPEAGVQHGQWPVFFAFSFLCTSGVANDKLCRKSQICFPQKRRCPG